MGVHLYHLKLKIEKWGLVVVFFGSSGQDSDDVPTGVSGDALPVAPHPTDYDHRSASRHRPALFCVKRVPPFFMACDHRAWIQSRRRLTASSVV